MADETDNTQTEELQRLLERAEAAKKSGDLELAAAILSEAALIVSDNWDIANELFDIAKDLLNTNSAAALMTIHFIRANYGDYDISYLENLDKPLFNRGWDLVESGELARGEELLRTAVKFYPQSPEWKCTLGYLLLNQQRYKEGISFLEQANELEDYNDDDDLLDNLEAIAWAEFKQDNKDQALQLLLDNYTYLYDDRVPQIYLRFVRLLDDKTAVGALEEMLDKLEEIGLIEEQPSIRSSAWLELARRYLSMGDKENELADFIASSEKFGKDVTALLGLGRVFLEIDSSDKALVLADRAIKLAPEDPRPLALRAQALLAQHDFATALQAAEDGLKLATAEPTREVKEKTIHYLTPPTISDMESEIVQTESDAHPVLVLCKVDALTGLERFGEALDTLGYARRLYPEEIIYYRYAAALLLKIGEPQEALIQLRLANKAKVKLDPASKDLQRKIKAALAEGK